MTKVTILYWQAIPSMVEARNGRERHKVQLSERFQELIDRVAMKKKLAGTDDYLTQWLRGAPQEHLDDVETAAKAVAHAIEARYEEIRSEALGVSGS